MSNRLNATPVLIAALALGAASASAQTKLLRFPDIAGDRVAFCYAGDLWTAPASGRHGHAAHRPPGPRAVPEVLARTASGSPSPASTRATSRST